LEDGADRFQAGEIKKLAPGRDAVLVVGRELGYS